MERLSAPPEHYCAARSQSHGRCYRERGHQGHHANAVGAWDRGQSVFVDCPISEETAIEHLKNAMQLLDSDHRVGFWERRVAQAAVRRRIEQALALLEPRT